MTPEEVRAMLNTVYAERHAIGQELHCQGPEWRAAGDVEAIQTCEALLSDLDVWEVWYLSFLTLN
jgi:hypothetical protein